MSTSQAAPAKRRWYKNIADAYRVTQASYPWMKWALIGLFIVLFGGSLAWGIASGHWIYLPLLGLLLSVLAMMVLLSLFTRRASYRQIEGQPGASVAVMQQVRGYNTDSDPVAVNPRSQDMIFRSVGRAGVVLVSEGPVGRTRRMVRDEERKTARILQNVPIHVLSVGNGDGQVKLSALESTMRKLPRKLTKQEVAAVVKRLHSLGAMRLPIPKGVDPMKARPDRRGMRGR